MFKSNHIIMWKFYLYEYTDIGYCILEKFYEGIALHGTVFEHLYSSSVDKSVLKNEQLGSHRVFLNDR